MNPKIKEFKIKGFKKKLYEIVCFLNPKEIFHTNERLSDDIFLQKVYSSSDREIKLFSIYDSKEHKYLEEDSIYNEALLFFKKQFDVFDKSVLMFFSINYNGEHFKVQCLAKDFYTNWSKIFSILNYPIIYDINHDFVLDISRLEYEIEVSLWKK